MSWVATKGLQMSFLIITTNRIAKGKGTEKGSIENHVRVTGQEFHGVLE